MKKPLLARWRNSLERLVSNLQALPGQHADGSRRAARRRQRRGFIPVLEGLERRDLMAYSTVISTAATANVSLVESSGTATFTATGSGANVKAADILTELQKSAITTVVIRSGTGGSQNGDITWNSSADLDFAGIGGSKTLQLLPDSSSLTGNITVWSQILRSGTGTEALSVDYEARGTLDLEGAVATHGGSITLTTVSGWISNEGALDAGSGGNVTEQSGGAYDVYFEGPITTGTGDITVTAGQHVRFYTSAGTLSAGGTVTLTAQNGRVAEEASGSTITAGSLIAAATTGVNLTNTNAVASFTVTDDTSSGGVTLNNAATTLTVAGITANSGGYITVTNTGAITTTGAVTTYGNGHIIFTAGGTLTVGAALSASTGNTLGTIELTANGGSSDIVVNASTICAHDISMTAGRDLSTNGAASLQCHIDITLTAAGNLSLGSSGSIACDVLVALSAGGWIHQTGTGTISAPSLTTSSGTGTSLGNANAVNTATAANTTSGDVVLSTAPTTYLTLNGVSQTGGGNVTVTATGELDTYGTISTSGNGHITLTATGVLAVCGPVTAGGSGAVSLTAGTGSMLYVEDAVSSTSGAITGSAASVSLYTSTASLSTSGNVTLTTGSAGSVVERLSGSSITAGLLTVTAATGVTLTNTGNAVASFSATNSTSGNVALINTASTLTVSGVSQTGGGNLSVTNTGNLQVTGAAAVGGAGTVSLTASGTNHDVTLSAQVTSGSGGVTATANRNVVLGGSGGVGTSGDVTLTGTAGTVSQTGTGTISGALLTTSSVGGTTLTGDNSVASFSATNATSGDIKFTNTAGALTLSGINQSSSGDVNIDNLGDIGMYPSGSLSGSGGALNFNGNQGSSSDNGYLKIYGPSVSPQRLPVGSYVTAGVRLDGSNALGGSLRLNFDWGDGSNDLILGPDDSGGLNLRTHAYDAPGHYRVTMKFYDQFHVSSYGPVSLSFPVTVTALPKRAPETCSSCNTDGGSAVQDGDGSGGFPDGYDDGADAGDGINQLNYVKGLGGSGGPFGHPVGAAPPSAFSAYPVRYNDGVTKIASVDLTTDGFGLPWGQARSWSNDFSYSAGSHNGNGWVDTQLPTLMTNDDGQTVAVVTNGTNARFFDLVSGSYVPEFFGQAHLTHNTTTHTFTLIDGAGDQLVFDDFSDNWFFDRQGQLESYTDPSGSMLEVTAHTNDGKVAEVQRSGASGSHTVTESYRYAYVFSGVGAGNLASVTLRQRTDSGPWATVRSVEYTYYDGTESHGTAGDLKTATTKDGAGNVINTDYYRYYVDGESNGYAGGLKYVFKGDSYLRLKAAYSDPTTATDTQAAPYADNYFQYDSQQRVTQEIAQKAGCSACSGGLGTFGYAYTTSTNAADYNSWAVKTVETLPDGNENVVYSNAYAEPILKVAHDTTSNQKWLTYFQYDGAGRLVLSAQPSAVSGYSESYNDLVINGTTNYYLNTSSGLVTLYNYATTTTATSSTAGDVAGHLQSVQIAHGYGATAVTQESMTYLAHADGNGVTIYPRATDTVYRNTNGTGAETTSYTYTWFSGTNQQQSVTVSHPVVSSGQNGPGTADAETAYFDVYGRPIWTKDADGFLNFIVYDPFTGAVIETIQDVNTALTSEFSNLPLGWSTASGGGLNLITTYTVDALGRTTAVTDPNGNVTYTVYNDANHEVRVYVGFNGSTGQTTGPTQVYRDDLSGSYTEALTMSPTPHLTGGVPDGTEAVGSVQTLSRSYTNDAGQVVEQDAYFNLSGVTYGTSAHIGTAGTNYYETDYGYDHQGRQNRVKSPTGTITRTVYDLLGRVVSVWVGTNDTPASGYWSPTNNTSPSNMVEVESAVYDNGGIGDNNLTALTQYPNGSTNPRETDYFYDWRDRAVAEKQGVETTESTSTNRPITYLTYDNLGEVTRQQQYDGDGVTITFTDGVPNAPSSSLLRAQTDTAYDDQGGAYQTKVYSVDPSSGSVSSAALTTNKYYDHRGNLIAVSAPGGLWTKTQFDGAGRLTVTYATDGATGTSWANAGSVASDTVLEQQEAQYDADSNLILMTDRKRFDSATGTGALGSPSGGIGARVYYAANYYDAANRLTASANVGSNGGSVYTRPGSVPARSDTVLVTSYGYNAAGWQSSMTDPGGIVTQTSYDALGRVAQTITDYTDGTPTASSNQTTQYTYDGDDHVLTVTAVLPASGQQQTQYVYGVTTAGGSAISSNDLLVEVKHPDPTTGAASSSYKDTYTVNALGQLATLTDRNGSSHTYTYDTLGRQVSDAVTTLASGVDGSVRRIETAYDSAGHPYLFTSYSAASGGSIVNQVERVYNGLGQLTAEYQSHSGAVNTSTTPKVQYVYAEMSGGANNSRLTEMIYPNGRILHYGYASGLDSSISRLSFLADDDGSGGIGTHLEEYTYLGLDSVVKRAHPQPGVDLTYIKQSGESNGDAGDQYTGLDRFGRIVDQRWLQTSTGTATDRVQYGYDRDGNRLYAANLVDAAFSELYAYNGENELTSFLRGTLNSTRTALTGSASRGQSWNLDALGNWSSVISDGTAQNRTSNAQNELTAVGASTLTYDNNGNLTTDDQGRTLIYDAWNQLVQVKNGSTVLQTYGYDGLGLRVTENSGTARDLYYSGWSVLEERVGGQAQIQYVWSPVGTNMLVLRDRDTNADGTFDERLYAEQDANGNVTSLMSVSGTVVERYLYDPYGQVSVLTGSWVARSSSSYAWQYLFQGGRFDASTGLYYYGERVYSPTLGRWLQQDPIGFYGQDTNLYRFVFDNPTGHKDPSGLVDSVDTTIAEVVASGDPSRIRALIQLLQETNQTGRAGYQTLRATLAAVEREAAKRSLLRFLDQLGRQCIKQTGPKARRMLIEMANKAGLKVVPGGNHYTVVDSAGRVVTQIPHSPHGMGTIKAICEAIKNFANQ